MKIYENNNYLILNKSPKIVSQGGNEKQFNLYDMILDFMKLKIYFVQRLDILTTGIIFLAKNRKAA